jgi:hypothetical protein
MGNNTAEKLYRQDAKFKAERREVQTTPPTQKPFPHLLLLPHVVQFRQVGL